MTAYINVYLDMLEKLMISATTSADYDNPGQVAYVVVSSDKDTYTVQGKTHGLVSHAIKHYQDLDTQVLNTAYLKFFKIFSDHSLKILNWKTGKIENVPLSPGIFANTLDRINDKVKQKKVLVEWEAEALGLTKGLVDAYTSKINSLTDSSKEVQSVDQITMGKFKIKTPSVTVHVDTSTRFLVVIGKSAFITAFSVSGSSLEQLKAKVKAQLANF